LWDGAGANCCPESGHHPFFDRGGNANTYTISVEVCTPNTNNQGLMTNAQVEALVYLIQTVCAELGIPTHHVFTYWNDYENTTTWIDTNAGGVGEHRDVSPHNKRMCTGDPHYSGQMQEVMNKVNGGIVTGDKDMYNYVLTLENRFCMTLPNVGGVWLAAIDGVATINARWKHANTGQWDAGGDYVIDSDSKDKCPLLIARSQDSDITELRLYFTRESRKYPDTGVMASVTFDPTTTD
jgi:hypothetical protein